jgi:hypothetical protein
MTQLGHDMKRESLAHVLRQEKQMLKFYVVKEDGTHAIVKFETLKEFWKYTSKNYIKEIQTLDNDTTYSFGSLTQPTVSDPIRSLLKTGE